MKGTRKNSGIREPGIRMPAMIPYVPAISIIGNLIAASGYQSSSFLLAITSTYAADSYKPVAGSTPMSITVNKNPRGYGFSKFITHLVGGRE
ncbi:hypothetical protein PENFLA_c023G05046 [Penicillium flavigenum]|uniref:Uncharacterized protein n=1 Tax=Penicillium flavigenum TaxID=254877 RepID=A0A1V6SUY3_9EURO|nr:hypothetical protein PENFLA_c023G05046 [Penicillium flavigenum]